MSQQQITKVSFLVGFNQVWVELAPQSAKRMATMRRLPTFCPVNGKPDADPLYDTLSAYFVNS